MGSDMIPWRMEEVACDYCGAAKAAPVYLATDLRYGSPGIYQIVRCENCGLVYLSPRPCAVDLPLLYSGQYQPHEEIDCVAQASSGVGIADDAGDSAASHGRGQSIKEQIKLELSRAYYGSRHATARKTLGRVGLILFQGYARALRHILYPGPAAGAYALDVGCGSGRTLKILQIQGWNTYGLEPSPKAAARAYALLGSGIVVATLPGACFRAESFDFVILSHVLEHTTSPREMLKQVHAMMRAGADLLVVVPNFDSPERKVAGAWWSHLEPPRHLYHFGTDTLRKYLERSGFRVNSFVRFSEAWALQQSLRWRFAGGARSRGLKLLPGSLVRIACFMLSLCNQGNILVAYCTKPEASGYRSYGASFRAESRCKVATHGS